MEGCQEAKYSMDLKLRPNLFLSLTASFVVSSQSPLNLYLYVYQVGYSWLQLVTSLPLGNLGSDKVSFDWSRQNAFTDLIMDNVHLAF